MHEPPAPRGHPRTRSFFPHLGGTSDALRFFMTLDYSVGACVAFLLTVYLVYALVRPERF